MLHRSPNRGNFSVRATSWALNPISLSHKQGRRSWLFLLVACYAILLGLLLVHGSYNLIVGVFVAHLLVVVTIPLLLRISRRHDNTRRISATLIAAFVAKLSASVLQYWVISRIYVGQADTAGYHTQGRVIAAALRSSEPIVLTRAVPGTGFIDWLTGVIYAFIGPSLLAAFLVYSLLSFFGTLLLYQAFLVGAPRGDAQRYLLLVMFLPSLLYWPSALGKDAWILFTLGLSAYGAALVLAYRARGFPWLLVGIIGAALVRPHIALLVAVSLAVTYLVAPSRRVSLLSPMAKTIGVVFLLALSALTLRQFESYISNAVGPDPLVAQSLEYLDETTSYGASAYQSVGGRTIADIPAAFVSVLFRPWPFEARGPLMLAAAIEGTALLMLLTWTVARRFRLLVRRCRESPYALFVLLHVALFSLVFSNIGNFGLLVRQRTQVLALLLVPIALVSGKVVSGTSEEPVATGTRLEPAFRA